MPPLRELENYIFNQMYNFLWSIMVDFAASDAAGVPVGRPPLHPPSREETAIFRWLEALQVWTHISGAKLGKPSKPMVFHSTASVLLHHTGACPRPRNGGFHREHRVGS